MWSLNQFDAIRFAPQTLELSIAGPTVIFRSYWKMPGNGTVSGDSSRW
jgi:hypothetical protein